MSHRDFCSYCGQLIEGKPPIEGWEGPITYHEGRQRWIIVHSRLLLFCSMDCAWQHGIKSLDHFGKSGKEIRRHLIESHGLTPPGRHRIKAITLQH